jgi:hypothetical protein
MYNVGFPFGKCTRSNSRPENVDVLCWTEEKEEFFLAIVWLQPLLTRRDMLGLECLTGTRITYKCACVLVCIYIYWPPVVQEVKRRHFIAKTQVQSQARTVGIAGNKVALGRGFLLSLKLHWCSTLIRWPATKAVTSTAQSKVSVNNWDTRILQCISCLCDLFKQAVSSSESVTLRE